MKKNNNSEERSADITDHPTGEYPILTETGEMAGPVYGSMDETTATSEIAGPVLLTMEETPESARAAVLLTHLETEVSRLHAKWQTIDAEIKTRETRIADLHDVVKAREAAIGRLNAELRREHAALAAADERLQSKDREIAALIEDQRTRDERITAQAEELAGAAAAHKTAVEELERTEAEAKRLSELVLLGQATTEAVRARSEEALAEQRRLQAELQDLETYIDGRHEKWSALNAELASSKDAVLQIEQIVKARDATIALHDEEKQALAARIAELERMCLELTGRIKEREAASDELQKKLAAHAEQAEQLKAEAAARIKEAEQVAKKVVDTQHHIESLDRGIKRRDETIESLTAELGQTKGAVNEAVALRDKISRRADELEKGITERTQQVQEFRENLRLSHEQLQAVQQQLSDRTQQLASTQEGLDQKSRLVERLNNELAAQRERISKLETDLRARQATTDMLERNVDRITDLGASLAALDKEMSAKPPHEDKSSVLHLADLVATIGQDQRAPAAQAAELPPLDLLLDGEVRHDNVIDIGERTAVEKADSTRKLVVTVDGADLDYPLVKDLVTIGRGYSSDIRLASHFVSRYHAKVYTDGNATFIEDVGSKNGILVNNQPVNRRMLHDGDVVTLGADLNLRFVDAKY